MISPSISTVRRLPPNGTLLASALAHVVAPVAAGAGVYLLWRAPTLAGFGWARAAGLGGVVESARTWAAGARPHVPDLVLFTLPDALWAYALTAALALVWRRARGRAGAAFVGLGAVLIVGGEAAQALGALPGTGDPADAALGLAAAALAFHLLYRRPAGVGR